MIVFFVVVFFVFFAGGDRFGWCPSVTRCSLVGGFGSSILVVGGVASFGGGFREHPLPLSGGHSGAL